MSSVRLGVTLSAGIALALCVLAAAAAQPHARGAYGGALDVGLYTGEPDSLDPTLERTTSATEVLKTLCEQLYDYDAKQQIVPQLAAALPAISPDKRTYTIPLRKGIVFNDGTPFNAQAVVTTIQRDLTLPESFRASDLSPIDTVATAGPYTVVIKLKTRFSPLTADLATADGMILSPTQVSRLGANFTTNPICVGPFTFASWVAGDSITVIKSPYYYNRAAVHLDKIVFTFTPVAAAAVAALKAGDIQVLEQVSPTELSAVQADSGLRTVKQNSLGWQALWINIANSNGVDNPPYTNTGTPLARNPMLRQAFEEAIDRKALVRVATSGAGVPGCTPLSPASPWFDASITCTPYNPSRAKKLVLAAGYSHPTVDLMVRSTTDRLLLAQFIQAEEAAVGINVVIDAVDQPTFIAREVAGDFDAMINGVAGTVDPDPTVYSIFASLGTRDYTGYSNPRVDLILANGRKASTNKARRTLYHVAQQLVLADRPMIFLYYPTTYLGFSTNVTGIQQSAGRPLQVAFVQLR